MSNRLTATQPRWLTLIALAAILCVAAITAGNARAADPAIFDVGAAAKNINPDTPQYAAGYGYKLGPYTATHDDLEVRAFVVGKGDHAAAFVVADLVGWFSAYKGTNLEPYGIDHTRERIAAALNAQGYNIDRKSVIISSTHVHAAPSVVGIWGTMDDTYLKKVADSAVAAATEAAQKAKPSEIWSGVGSARSFVWQNGQGTNHPDGFSVDEELPVMWARDPDTGATNALYANVPNHPDQFNPEDNLAFSADWPGFARRKLDELNGGTSVIAAGTLGRQEPPGSDPSYTEVIPQGQYVANQIQRTMANATPLTSDTIQGTEAYMQTPADNEDLLLAMNFYSPPSGACFDVFEKCAIPRSTELPYLDASGPGDPLLGTFIPSIRIGDLMYTSNPGEAFPEVNDAIRNSVTNDRHTNVVGMSNDMLGYYYQRDDYTDEQFGSSDFEDFNVGPDLAQDNADLSIANAAALGFSTTTPPVVHAPFDATVKDKIGMQFYTNRVESSDPQISFYGGAPRSQDKTIQAPATYHMEFGDGTIQDVNNTTSTRYSHTYPGPGTYTATATATGSNGKTRTWTELIKIDPVLNATASLKSRTYDGATVNVETTAGSGTLIGAVWTCQDGEKVNGATATCASKDAGTAIVTAADSAGNTATASVAIPAAPPKPAAKLKITKINPKTRTVKRGKAGTVSVTIKNTGNATASKVKVCLKVPKKQKKGIKPQPACKKPGSINAGKTKTVKLKAKLTKKAANKTKVTIEVTASDTKKVTGTVTFKAKQGKSGKTK